MKLLLNELDTHRPKCDRRRYFIVVYQGEAKLIFWAQYYNYTHLVNRMIGSSFLSISEATPAEAETLEIIGEVSNLHLMCAEKWMNKKGWRNARR